MRSVLSRLPSTVPCPQFPVPSLLPPVPCPQLPVPNPLSPVPCPQFPAPSSCLQLPAPHFLADSSLSGVHCVQNAKVAWDRELGTGSWGQNTVDRELGTGHPLSHMSVRMEWTTQQTSKNTSVFPHRKILHVPGQNGATSTLGKSKF